MTVDGQDLLGETVGGGPVPLGERVQCAVEQFVNAGRLVGSAHRLTMIGGARIDGVPLFIETLILAWNMPLAIPAELIVNEKAFGTPAFNTPPAGVKLTMAAMFSATPGRASLSTVSTTSSARVAPGTVYGPNSITGS